MTNGPPSAYDPEVVQAKLAGHALWLRAGGPESDAPAGTERLRLIGADLCAWDLTNFGLRHADLRRARLKSAAHADFRDARLDRADLAGADLEHADLRAADLRRADLRAAILRHANLEGADLRHARLQGADLYGANLGDAQLYDANLHDTSLANARLQGTALKVGQLGGADVSGAELPPQVASFDGLSIASERSENARKVFFLMLAACFLSWLALWNTTDAALITNAVDAPLPLIDAPIAIAASYVVAPFLLLCIYLYFLLYLQRLWEDTADLPAVFPDGRSIVRKAYPWLPMGLLREYVPRLKERDRLPLQHLQTLLAGLVIWFLVPLTLVWYWWRCLPLRDVGMTAAHCVLIGVAVTVGTIAFDLAGRTLRGELRYRYASEPAAGSRRNAPSGTRPSARIWRPSAVVVCIAAPTVAVVFSILSYQQRLPPARIAGADVSIKPPGWTGAAATHEAELAQVRGARLAGVDLRAVDAAGAFLAAANLGRADLRDGRFDRANLAGADLRRADLRGASLMGADLRDADLRRARLEGARLDRADLRGAMLTRADLSRAGLDHAQLEDADLRYADLARARLIDADLGEAKLLGARLVGADLGNARLANAELIGADLRDAKLRFADLEHARALNADLRCADLRKARIDGLELDHAAVDYANLDRASGLVKGQFAPARGEPVFASREQADHLCAPLREAWRARADEAPISTGARLFGLCAPCHSLEPGEHGIGPSLAGVFNREAGRVVGFNASPALELAEVSWDWPTLDRYLQDPALFIPGQQMRFIGLEDRRERNALIAFLAALPEEGAPKAPGTRAAPACDARPERGFDAARTAP